MKVKCSNCGKSFNYEKQEGVCKHCGRYMRNPVSAGIQEHYRYETLENTSKLNQKQIDKTESTSKTKKEKKNHRTTPQKISCIVILATMAMLFLVVYYDTNKQVAASRQIKEVGIIPSASVEMEQDIQMGDGILSITGYGGIKEWKEYVPEGFRLVYVEFVIKQEMEDYFRYHTKPYLKLPETTYIEPVSKMRLAEEVGSDWEALEENYGIYDCFEGEKGHLLFLVPEETKDATFVIQYFSEQELSTKDVVDKLNNIYEISINLEVQ